MSDHTDPLLERVRAIIPDLKIDHFERNSEGLINDVLIVNRELVFRFAKTEEYAGLLQVEMKILDLIHPQVGIRVPTPLYRSSDCIVYPLLNGRALSRKMALECEENIQEDIAGQLGDFLYRLHNLAISGLDWELPSTRAPVKRQNWLDLRERIREKIYPLLLEHQMEWAEELFHHALDAPGFFEYEPALIHGDLASYHILFDDQEQRISGVIDFGTAGLGDPASDIGILINVYGESFVKKMRTSYPDLEKYLPRARFYAQSIELEWILLGIETGESFWFTAHIGGARDVH